MPLPFPCPNSHLRLILCSCVQTSEWDLSLSLPSCLSCLVKSVVRRRTGLISRTPALADVTAGLDVSIQAPVLTPCSAGALSGALSFTHPLLLPPLALPMFLLTSSLVLSSCFLLPEALYPFHFSFPEPFSLPPSLVTLSCHPPSSLPIRICSAGDQSQRDVFSSTAAITQNSISPNLK